MSAVAELTEMVIDLRRRLATLEKEVARNKIGTISDRDPVRGYRVKYGEDENGEPKKSPWLPHPEHGGAARTWHPLTNDQPVMVISPPGDPRKAVLLRAGYAGSNEPPTQSMDEHVLIDFGAARISVKEDRIVFSVGATTVTLREEDIVALVGRSSITMIDKDITIKARRHYLRGKVAAGLNYSDAVKEFPSNAVLVSGNAKNLFGKVIGDDIPDDD